MAVNCAFVPIALSPTFTKTKGSKIVSVTAKSGSNRKNHHKSLPKNLRYPRRTKLPPDFGVNHLKKPPIEPNSDSDQKHDEAEQTLEQKNGAKDDVVWDPEEIEAISSLFQGRVPQKPGKLNRERPLHLPLPHKIRPLGLPQPKRNIRSASPTIASLRASMSKKLYKNPSFLVGIAREIKELASDEDLAVVLNNCVHLLRKGSLSLTIRELGHLGLPDRALQAFCWAQKHPHLFPDDRIFASTVEVLARHHELKLPFSLDNFVAVASKNVIEALVRGFIKGGWLSLARKLLLVAKVNKRKLDPSVYAKLILELGRNPDKQSLLLALLDELGQREQLNLSQQDCTAVMKVCIRIGKFDTVESLFNWLKQSGNDPSVVTYTTLIHSHYSGKRYREAMAVIWEMEASNCLFDLPAYRVAIKLFVAMNDLSRAVRYFSKLKEAGFSPTYDIYRDMIDVYQASECWVKCKEVCKELQAVGLKLDKSTSTKLLQCQEVAR